MPTHDIAWRRSIYSRRDEMRKTMAAAVFMLLGGVLLGGTVFRDQVAHAAQAVLQVNVVNPTTSPVPVRQQGTTDVNVTNGSLAVNGPGPVTSGGQRLQAPAGTDVGLGASQTASAIVVQFRNGASELIFRSNNTIVARFPGPGPLVLALTQPIRFDELRCGGPDGSSCDLGWAGSAS
jgi:hypothetical protein